MHEAVPIAWAAKALLMNQFYCDDPSVCGVSFVTPPLPGMAPVLISRYNLFVARYQWTYEQRWEALANLGWCILAYRVAATLAWRMRWGAAKA